ncbi:MAG: hypothetical protein WAL97_02365 [Halobacteriota archaeon]
MRRESSPSKQIRHCNRKLKKTALTKTSQERILRRIRAPARLQCAVWRQETGIGRRKYTLLVKLALIRASMHREEMLDPLVA